MTLTWRNFIDLVEKYRITYNICHLWNIVNILNIFSSIKFDLCTKNVEKWESSDWFWLESSRATNVACSSPHYSLMFKLDIESCLLIPVCDLSPRVEVELPRLCEDSLRGDEPWTLIEAPLSILTTDPDLDRRDCPFIFQVWWTKTRWEIKTSSLQDKRKSLVSCWRFYRCGVLYRDLWLRSEGLVIHFEVELSPQNCAWGTQRFSINVNKVV